VTQAAIALHRERGPGLLETVYAVIPAGERVDRGLKVDRQLPVPITHKWIRIDEGFRADWSSGADGSWSSSPWRA
jgi:GxxExxY protein